MADRRDPASPSNSARSGDRIAKLLARAGVASRREVERMIAEGRVARAGVVVDTPNTVLSSLADITVDGKPVAAPPPARLYIYHKPVGLLVTERDPNGRPTIYDRLPADLPRLVPVGRLDLNTEGLLLLTTDGGLKRQLELPSTGVERTYRARAYGEVSQAQLEALIEGVEIDGVRYGQIDANLERRTGANVWIEMTLTEGKNREVRRVLEHLGLQVGRLIRTRYGPFILGDLPPGEIGEVRQHDLVAFRQSLNGKRGGSTDPIAPAPLRQPRRAEPAAGDASKPAAEHQPATPKRHAVPAKHYPAAPKRHLAAPKRHPGEGRGPDGERRPSRTSPVLHSDTAPGSGRPAVRGRGLKNTSPDPRAPRRSPTASEPGSNPDLRRGESDGRSKDRLIARPKRQDVRRGPMRPSSDHPGKGRSPASECPRSRGKPATSPRTPPSEPGTRPTRPGNPTSPRPPRGGNKPRGR